MTTTKLTAADLRQFTGTEHWYRHSLARGVLYTDGVQYLAEQAGAYWLIDIIALAQRAEPAVQAQDFQVWTLTVQDDHTATLTCDNGNRRTLHTQRIDYTDFPMPEIVLWVEGPVILLPSEH